MIDVPSCRICRGESTDDEPLYHPCKCSGSIKYVHQECLMEWLSHSNNKPQCELCHTKFLFAKQYKPNMPKALPMSTLLKRLCKDTGRFFVKALRVIACFSIWVVLLPLFVAYAVRCCTVIGDNIPNNPLVFLSLLGTQMAFHVAVKTPSPLVNILSLTNFGFSAPSFWSTLLESVDEGVCLMLTMGGIAFLITMVRDWVLQNDDHVEVLNKIHTREMDRITELELSEMMKVEKKRLEELEKVFARAFETPDGIGNNHSTAINGSGNNGHTENQQEAAGDAGNDGIVGQEEPAIFNRNQNLAHRIALGAEAGRRAEIPQRVEGGGRPFQFAQAEVDAGQDLQDQEDVQPGEVEGIMEMIGMGGPFIHVLENSLVVALLMVLLSLVLYLVPHAVGRTICYCLIPLAKGLVKFLPDQLVDMAAFTILYLTGAGEQGIKYKSEVMVRNKVVLEAVLEHLKLFEQRWNNSTFILEWTPVISNAVFADRFLCIVVGYMFLFGTAVLYARSNFRFTSTRTAAVVEIHLLQNIVQFEANLKVIALILIELVVFPICCGIMLAFASMPIIETASFKSVYLYAINKAGFTIFCLWCIGTMYMYNFAKFIAMCRTIMRPGVLYFVKDPKDPDFHPIEDIQTRPFTSQLGKIGLSIIIYTIMIVVCIGAVTFAMYHAYVRYHPLVIPSPDSFLSFSLSTLVIISLPFVISVVVKLRILLQLWSYVVKVGCRLLRLSSFILDERYKDEEVSISYKSLNAIALGIASCFQDGMADEALEKLPHETDGNFVRAPSRDYFDMSKKLKLFIPVDADDNRLDGKEQDEDTDIKDYTLVYKPPHFWYRVCFFLLIVWIVSTVVVSTLFLLPHVVGKYLATRILSLENSNDISYLLTGVYPVFGLLYGVDKLLQFRINPSQTSFGKFGMAVAEFCLFFALEFLLMPYCFGLLSYWLIEVDFEIIKRFRNESGANKAPISGLFSFVEYKNSENYWPLGLDFKAAVSYASEVISPSLFGGNFLEVWRTGLFLLIPARLLLIRIGHAHNNIILLLFEPNHIVWDFKPYLPAMCGAVFLFILLPSAGAYYLTRRGYYPAEYYDGLRYFISIVCSRATLLLLVAYHLVCKLRVLAQRARDDAYLIGSQLQNRT